MRINAAFRQSQLPAAKLLEIKLSQAFRPPEIALRIVRYAVSSKEIAEVEPKARLRIMRVDGLEAFDVANGLRSATAIFKLRHSRPDCSKPVAWRDLGRSSHCDATSGRDDEC